MAAIDCQRTREFIAGLMPASAELVGHASRCSDCREALAGGSPVVARRARRSRGWRATRSIALPLVALVLLSQAFPVDAKNEIACAGGVVELAGRPLAAGEVGAAKAGNWLATAVAARASVELSSCEIQLGESTLLGFEAIHPARARLACGELDAGGRITIATACGVIELDGAHARIRASTESVALEVFAGRVRLCDSSGERVVDPGSRAELHTSAR